MQDRTHLDKFWKCSFDGLLSRIISESLILSDQEFYEQNDGVAMVSSLELKPDGNIWLHNCRSKFKPAIYGKCVDDIYILMF